MIQSLQIKRTQANAIYKYKECDAMNAKEAFLQEQINILKHYDSTQLKTIAKERGIKLHTTNKEKMLEIIAETTTNREFHGYCFLGR
jgi:hypothetical protein